MPISTIASFSAKAGVEGLVNIEVKNGLLIMDTEIPYNPPQTIIAIGIELDFEPLQKVAMR